MPYKATVRNEELRSYLKGANHFWSTTGEVGPNYQNFWQDVMLVQYLINSAWDAGLACDGSYGPKTASAIRKTQRAFSNVKVDGKVNLAQGGTRLYSSVSNSIYTILALNSSLKTFSPYIYDNILIDKNMPAILRAELLSEVYDVETV